MRTAVVLSCVLALCALAVLWTARHGSRAPELGAPPVREPATSAPRDAAGVRHVELAVAHVAGETPEQARAPAPVDETRAEPVRVRPLAGVVVDADGSAAVGATVFASGRRAITDAAGRFELDADGAEVEPTLVAVLAGRQPAIAHHVRARWVELVLGPPTLAIAGRLCDASGRPVKGWSIGALDATVLDALAEGATTIEHACSERNDARRTASDGSFEVRGLAERDYTVAAWRSTRNRIELVASAPTRAGARDLLLVIPGEGAEQVVALRVVDAQGAFVPDLRVGWPSEPAVAGVHAGGTLQLAGALPPSLSIVLASATNPARARDVELAGASTVTLVLR